MRQAKPSHAEESKEMQKGIENGELVIKEARAETGEPAGGSDCEGESTRWRLKGRGTKGRHARRERTCKKGTGRKKVNVTQSAVSSVKKRGGDSREN